MLPYIAVMYFGMWLLIFFAKGTVSKEDCIIGKVGEISADFLDGEQRKLFKTEGIRSIADTLVMGRQDEGS